MSFPIFIAKRTVFGDRKNLAGIILRLAIAAYALSIAVMIIASGLIRGFKKEISDKMFDCWGHIHIVKAGSGRSLEQESITIDSTFYPSLNELEQIEYQEWDPVNLRSSQKWNSTKAGIESIQYFANLPGILTHEDEYEGIVFKGVGKDYDWSFFDDYVVRGSLPDVQNDKETDQLMISSYVANRLRLDTSMNVIVHFIRNNRDVKRRFQISGIFNTGFSDFDNQFALCDIRKIQRVLGWDANMIGGYEVFLENIDDMEAINDYIYDKVLPPQLVSESIRTKFPEIFNWLELQNTNEWVIMILMLIVAIINLVIMLLILILERSRMIGILKSIGTSDASIQRIFLFKAAIIVAAGTIIGNVCGLALCWLQKTTRFIKLDQENYFLDYAPIHIDPWIVLMINVVSFVICLIALILPSLLIRKISITRILRFE